LEFGKLKNVPRTGWLLRGLGRCSVESVADHVARTSFIAMSLADALNIRGVRLDGYKVVEMSLLHDISEAMLLDIDRRVSELIGEGLKKNAEKAIEEFALKQLEPNLRDRYLSLLKDYREGNSVEAQVVKVSDKLETLIQALEYEESGFSTSKVQEFWEEKNHLPELIKDSALKDLVAEIIDELNHRRRTVSKSK
jgi:putative hydrolase of HD superfamily